jgi:Nucleoporin autopeptidase
MNIVASTSSVPNFIVGRKGYGTISFKSPVDLTDITSLTILREIVQINRSIATIYPDDSKKPPLGKGLNVPAEITLENVRAPPDFEGDEYIEELRAMPDTNFVSYDLTTGLWVFTVEHFSSYGIRSVGRGVAEGDNRRSTTRKLSANTAIPSASGDPTDRYGYLSREQAAKKLFKKLVKQLIETGQPPAQERTDELNTYSDVMTADKVFEWKYAEGLRGGILWDDDTCSLMFIEVPGELHDAISSAVLDIIKDQFPGHILKTRGSASELSLDLR